MAERIYKQPQPGRKNDEPDISPGITTPSGQQYQRPSNSVYDSDKTLSGIDKVLAESEKLNQAVPSAAGKVDRRNAGPVPFSDAYKDEMSALNRKTKAAPAGDTLGKGYTPPAGTGGKKTTGKFGRLGAAFKGWSSRRKAAFIASAIGGIAGLGGGLFGLFGLLNIFQLDHFLNNVEAKGFVRYQVDMEGRSNHWLAAYLALRLAEIEDPSLKPANRDNIIFRANTVEASNPAFTWYKLMRGGRFSPLNDYVTQFEQDLLEKNDIKFASIACKGNITADNECITGGNTVRFRPAVITIKDEQIKFDLTEGEIRAIENGDINGFNNRLRQFIDVEIISNDKEARKQISRAVKANTEFYQVIKRWTLRKAIQNMTGVRDWRFFETTRLPCVYSPTQLQTRDECLELRRSIFNKIIAKTFPESMKGGRWIQCIFGITSCKTTTDPNDPEHRSALEPLPDDCGESTNPKCKSSVTDAEGNGVQKDTEAVDGLKEGVSGGGAADNTSSITKKITLQILKKLSGPLAVLSIIDQINIINENVEAGAISNTVYMGRATQAIGLFTTLGIMRDQIRTGEVQAEEVDAAMEFISNAGNSEGWQNVVAAGDSKVGAAPADLKTTNNKNKYCSPEFQEQMIQPKNREVANKQFHWLCPSEKIGGESLAKDIENGWKSSVGAIVKPILAVYNKSGLSTVMGWFNSALDAIFEKTVAPLMKAILSATGLGDKLEDLMAWLTTKIAAVLGAGPALSENSPGGVVANHALMGSSAAAEFGARATGAARTTATTSAEARQRVAAYEEEQRQNTNTFDKYLALSNPDSVAARGLFAVTNGGAWQTFTATLGSLFSGSVFAQQNDIAQGDPYAAAKFGGIQTYDFPGHCSSAKVPAAVSKLNIAELDANDSRRNYFPLFMTPLSSTNADDLGLIEQKDLSWDFVRNYEQFTNKLYEDENADSEKIKRVWNCALLDSAVRTGLGATQNSKILDENTYGFGQTGSSQVPQGAVGDLPTGTTQELAQRILDNPNIDFQVKPKQENWMKDIARTGKGSACGGPTVSPTLLGVILALAEKYKLVIGVLVDGHSCNNGFHPKGMAVDINGVNPLSGSGGTGNRIEWSAAEQGILKRFYEDAGPLLSQAGGGGLGQIGCFKGTKPTRADNVSYFADTCHHVHMDVGKR
jgi:hypothetical protein